MSADRQRGLVLGVPIDALSWASALDRLMSWAHGRQSRMVAICNVHVVVTAARNAGFGAAINAADMATPDGAPVAWMLRRTGFPGQERISGPELMWLLCERCAERGTGIFLYGSTREVLAALEQNLCTAFPALRIAGSISPPFRPLTPREDQEVVEAMNCSGAGVVFVGLGCPRQEMWMAEHRGRVRAVMIGGGAAFDFHAGTLKRAPLWMRQTGLEWLHRLVSEPRRLWKRYLVTNALFVIGAVRQLMSQ